MSKKKPIIVTIMILLIVSWIIGIYKLSEMNSKASNGASTDIISEFIITSLGITNEYGITSSYPTEAKLERASKLLNSPLRKVMHASVYFVLAFIIMTMLSYLLNHNRYFISILATISLVFLAASFDEYHQTKVDGRTGQYQDVLIDTAGGLGGILFSSSYYLVYKLGYNKRNKEQEEIELEKKNHKKR